MKVSQGGRQSSPDPSRTLNMGSHQHVLRSIAEKEYYPNQIFVITEEPYKERARGVRNIRYRLKMKADRKESLKRLGKDKIKLTEKVNRLRWEQNSLQSRKEEVSKALQLDEVVLNTRLQTALRKLKDERPDLFQITLEEQLGKIDAALTGSFIRYLIE